MSDIQLLSIEYVKLKIEDLYLVWIENCDQFFQLQEPAWFVFEKIVNNENLKMIASIFSDKYDLDIEESLRFVADMHSRLEGLDRIKPAPNPLSERELLECNLPVCGHFSLFEYLIGNTVVKIAYETTWLEDYIHPLIEHLIKNDKSVDGTTIFYELYTIDERVVLRKDNAVIGVWKNNESERVKGRVYLELVNLLHDKNEEDWLMTIHASAISNGRKTILFTAAPGSGKTTMAAMLRVQGYKLISDDFVPIDKYLLNAFPFPIAMSVKEGSMNLLLPHFPELNEKQVNYISSEKKVRYLPIGNELMDMIFPVREIMFVKYDPESEFEIEQLNVADALPLLFEQIWVTPTKENVEILFTQISNFSFYKITYPDNRLALEAIKDIFNDE